ARAGPRNAPPPLRTAPAWRGARRASPARDRWPRTAPLRLVRRLEPVQDRLDDLVRVLVRVDLVPGGLGQERAAEGRAGVEPDRSALLGDHQGAALRAAALVQLAKSLALVLPQALELLVVQLAQPLGVLACEVFVLGGARLLFEGHLPSL